VALARLSYAPFAQSAEHVPPGPLLLSVESGSLTVALQGRGRPAAERADRSGSGGTFDARSTELRAGESLVVPARTGLVVRNPGSEEAGVLAAAIVPASATSWTDAAGDGASSQPPAWWPVSSAPGSRLTPLATSAATGLGVGEVEVGIGRVTLAPAAHLSPVDVSAPVRLAVEEGILGLALADGPLRAETSGWCEKRLLTGQQWLVPAGTRPMLRNAGTDPLVVLILTLSPVKVGTE
jgi:mannose-6-phosphate isomerase-like protein (cupin superfamily)